LAKLLGFALLLFCFLGKCLDAKLFELLGSLGKLGFYKRLGSFQLHWLVASRGCITWLIG
jgi:hypothetical protein